MDDRTVRQRVAAAPVGRLATFHPDHGPHLVPITFAVHADTLVTAVDHKPKRTAALRRLTNIEVEPRVAVLVDHYEDDWSRLWWVRVDGRARIVSQGPEHQQAADLLGEKYEQYRGRPPEGPAILIEATGWRGWTS